ncbi:MAG: right-handed parallel beta-helix repeat-containing protein [Rubrobacteraceae bacterium]|nr:right-handed parallel beta-helix repeat-containing protein [Rubrobacteraceae bacterium]
MRRTIPLLSTMALTLLVASGLALAGVGSASAESSVVGPGGSIQKAINAADPGDTIVVKGVHREDVAIRKDGIKLRGDHAVIEPPARAGSPCSRAFGPSGICVLGDVNLNTFKVDRYVSDVSVSGFTIRGFREGISAYGARNTTLATNHAIGNTGNNIVAFAAPGTEILSSVLRGPSVAAIFVGGASPANAKIAANEVSGSDFGIFVGDARGGSVAGNEVHNNCAGVFFATFEPGPVGDFDVKGNTVKDNNRACPEIDISGIGIALFGTRNIEVTGNQISGNIRSGSTKASGGVVVADGSRDSSVTGNRFGRNKPDIFWDKSGSGNRFVGNLCDTSVPARLCN